MRVPIEIIANIAEHLPPGTLVSLATVNKACQHEAEIALYKDPLHLLTGRHDPDERFLMLMRTLGHWKSGERLSRHVLILCVEMNINFTDDNGCDKAADRMVWISKLILRKMKNLRHFSVYPLPYARRMDEKPMELGKDLNTPTVILNQAFKLDTLVWSGQTPHQKKTLINKVLAQQNQVRSLGLWWYNPALQAPFSANSLAVSLCPKIESLQGRLIDIAPFLIGRPGLVKFMRVNSLNLVSEDALEPQSMTLAKVLYLETFFRVRLDNVLDTLVKTIVRYFPNLGFLLIAIKLEEMNTHAEILGNLTQLHRLSVLVIKYDSMIVYDQDIDTSKIVDKLFKLLPSVHVIELMIGPELTGYRRPCKNVNAQGHLVEEFSEFNDSMHWDKRHIYIA